MDEPKFLKEKTPQECEDHALWQKHLMIAHYGLLGLAILIGVLSGDFLIGITFIVASWVMFAIAVRLGTKHAKWHLENNKKGKH